MKELDVLHALIARSDNYSLNSANHVRGRLYRVNLNGEYYTAVVLVRSFDYYELRYHIMPQKPDLVVCYEHDTVVPVPVLSTRAGNLAKAYELPESITNIEEQRTTRTGTRVLLGMYISGVRKAQTLVNSLPDSTRKRYMQRVEELGRRRPGRPVGE